MYLCGKGPLDSIHSTTFAPRKKEKKAQEEERTESPIDHSPSYA